MKNLDPERLSDEAKTIQWNFEDKYSPEDEVLDARVNQLETKIQSLVDKHAPLKVIKINPMKINWITNELKEEIHVRNQMKMRLETKGGSNEEWRSWKKFRNQLNKKL